MAGWDAVIDDREWGDRFMTIGLVDRWDLNGGGTLDDHEIRTGMFEWADSDDDGYLDDGERGLWALIGRRKSPGVAPGLWD